MSFELTRLLGDVMAPSLAAVFFLAFYFYFAFARYESKKYHYFSIYLLAFSIFLLGRPLQLFVGSHPWPLIIVSIRMLLLCAVCAPMIYLAPGEFGGKGKRESMLKPVLIGLGFGLLYVIFHILGTKGSIEYFKLDTIVAFDNDIPSMASPLYAREITLFIQISCITIFFFASGYRSYIFWRNHAAKHEVGEKKFIFFGLGTIIFAICFVIGTLSKQWWLIYGASVPIAVLLGYGVFLDIKEAHLRFLQVMPLLKEEILQDVAFIADSSERLVDMLNLLGRCKKPDTFVIVKLNDERFSALEQVAIVQRVTTMLADELDSCGYALTYFIVSMGGSRLGLFVETPTDRAYILKVGEIIRETLKADGNLHACIGIGRRYDSICDLRFSYREAFTAQEYALSISDDVVVHVDDIQEFDQNMQYPVVMKERLLQAVRLANLEGIKNAATVLLARFQEMCHGNISQLKARVYELLGSVIDSASAGGGDISKLIQINDDSYEHLFKIKDADTLHEWFESYLSKLVKVVGSSQKKRTRSVIKRAMAYMKENFKEKLSVDDVASEVSISPSHFKRLFKNECGETFTGFLARIRIEFAKEQLRDPSLTISEVAFAAGYTDSNYFSIVFKKVEGCSPRQYRNSFQ